MKNLLAFICLIMCASQVSGVEAPVEINLLDGSRIKGRVMSVTPSEFTFMSDFGISRIPLDKLTPESRQSITQGTKPDVDALLKRIAELDAKVSQLQQENEALRRQIATAPPSAPIYRPSGAQSLTPTGSTTQPAAGASHTISSTGKRHNSGCRYFGSGRSCGPADGIACKICGG